MDITQLTQNLIKGLEQKSVEQITALSRALNMILGKTIIASVIESHPVTTQEREELLKQTLEALTQLEKQTTAGSLKSPALQAEITRLKDQVELLKSPELIWAKILINNKSLLTYTDPYRLAKQYPYN
jgi:hypothetical protein